MRRDHHGQSKTLKVSPASGPAEPEGTIHHEPAGDRYLDYPGGKGEGMNFTKETLTKILDKITEVWQSRSDIVGWTGLNRETVRTYLHELERQGKIESMWDGNLGIRYYRRVKARLPSRS